MKERVIAVAIGDPNGIGPEIAVRAAAEQDSAEARLLLVGDWHVLAHYAAQANARIRTLSADEPLPPAEHGLVDIVQIDALPVDAFAPGRCDAASGRAMVFYLDAALTLARTGRADALIGCPHHEGAVNAAGIPFSGYPSLLARLTDSAPDSVFLMLSGAGLNIVHATLHESLERALRRLSIPLVCAAARAAATALRAQGVAEPRIGLFGIDPHAGESGLFGSADRCITFPAAEALRAEGMSIVGPQGADLMLSQGGCDAYVAMIHDQGHIPIKLLAGRDSTAFSIGADFLFASVGHGSAPDIAGRNCADPAPLRHTIARIAQRLPAPAPSE